MNDSQRLQLRRSNPIKCIFQLNARQGCAPRTHIMLINPFIDKTVVGVTQSDEIFIGAGDRVYCSEYFFAVRLSTSKARSCLLAFITMNAQTITNECDRDGAGSFGCNFFGLLINDVFVRDYHFAAQDHRMPDLMTVSPREENDFAKLLACVRYRHFSLNHEKTVYKIIIGIYYSHLINRSVECLCANCTHFAYSALLRLILCICMYIWPDESEADLWRQFFYHIRAQTIKLLNDLKRVMIMSVTRWVCIQK